MISRNDRGFSQRELDREYEHFIKKMSDKTYVKTYREYSSDAVKHFEDNFFDLIYIDADHTYKGCLQDIIEWYPKVKNGGLLLGDDYKVYQSKTGVDFGVIEAVNRFAKDNNLNVLKVNPDGWGFVKN
jgi:predicted O-methyltransferase YrrM